MRGVIGDPPSVYDIPSNDRRDIFHLWVVGHNVYVQFIRIKCNLGIAKYQKSTFYKAVHDSAQTAALIVAIKPIIRDSESLGISRH